MDMHKDKEKSKTKQETMDIHLILPLNFSLKRLIQEAKDEDRSITAQFRRIIEKVYPEPTKGE